MADGEPCHEDQKSDDITARLKEILEGVLSADGASDGDGTPDEAIVEKTQKIVSLVKDGASDDFKKINFSLGMRGGLALLNAVINNCPGLKQQRRKHLSRQIVIPWGFEKEHFGTLRFQLPAGGERPEVVVKFMRTGEADASYSLTSQTDKLAVVDDKETNEVVEKIQTLTYFTRMAYIELLNANKKILDELAPKLGEIDIRSFHYDEINCILYFRPVQPGDDKNTTPKIWLPMAAIFVDDEPAHLSGGGC